MRRFLRHFAVIAMLAASLTAEQHPVRTHYVLDRWLAALGGKQRLQAVNTAYVKALIVRAGQIGTLEVWQTAKGTYKTTLIFGDHEITTACDGKTGWSSVDGAVQDLSADVLAGAITRSYLASYSQFFPDRLPGTVEWVREDENEFVINVEPAGGSPVIFYMDKRSGLPTRYETSAGDSTQSFSYLEWQEYEGIKTWKRGRDDEADLTVTVQEVQWNPKLDPKVFQKPATPAQ